ncbi:MAG: CHASE3 domain-containing protein, partial [Microcoleaceae cyanobacterium]
RGAIAMAIPLLCLITSFSTHLWFRERDIQVENAVDHSQMVLLESYTLLVEMINAETGVRGYYVSRQPEFLQPYEQALTTLPKIFERLNYLLKDNPTQAERIKSLERLASQKLEILSSGIQQIEPSTPNTPPITPLNLPLAQGKAVMDEFRLILQQLEIEEQQLLKSRQQNLQYRRDFNILVILLGIVISSLGLAFAIELLRNLTKELRHREFRLQESDNLIRAVFANVADGVVVLNRRCQIEGINHSAEHMFSYTLQELAGKDWRLLLAQDVEVNKTLSLSGEELSQTDRPWQSMGRRKNDQWFPIEVSVSVIEFDDRRVLIIRDVTERQQAAAKLQMRADELAVLNAKLQATNEALSERNRELDQFVYVVSHDLKAPLRAIANLSTWIEEDLMEQLPLANQKHMQLLRGRVYRMESLLNGLLDYARIGRTESPIESVDVAQLVASVIQIIAPPSTFQFEIASPMPTLLTRRLRLHQVFLNLIENAVDHHPKEMGIVKISVQDQGDHYEFAISDDGQGIDPQFYNKIYTIFQTLQTRDIHESRGVGLAMVKKIVKMEGGQIQLESVVGEGCTFRFTWLKQPLNQNKPSVTFVPIDRSI